MSHYKPGTIMVDTLNDRLLVIIVHQQRDEMTHEWEYKVFGMTGRTGFITLSNIKMFYRPL